MGSWSCHCSTVDYVVIPDKQITTYTSVAAVIQWTGMLEVQIYSYASCSSVQYTKSWLVELELVHYKISLVPRPSRPSICTASDKRWSEKATRLRQIRSGAVSVSFHCRRLNSSNRQLKRSMLILLAIHSHTCIPIRVFNQHRNVSDLTIATQYNWNWNGSYSVVLYKLSSMPNKALLHSS